MTIYSISIMIGVTIFNAALFSFLYLYIRNNSPQMPSS